MYKVFVVRLKGRGRNEDREEERGVKGEGEGNEGGRCIWRGIKKPNWKSISLRQNVCIIYIYIYFTEMTHSKF